ncbi:hypothetical protein IWQ61_007753 [Dispira simplex]|nr:hypothetical protein IWQ61_007753 [Dispira simplex]
MKALVVHDRWLQSTEELVVEPNAPVPTLQPNQVLVKIMAVAGNFFDILMVQGQYQIKPPRPFTPGVEFAGIVVRSHPSVNQFPPGIRVFGSETWGVFAEYAAVSISHLHVIPRRLSFEEACGLSITYPTSYTGLVVRADIQAEDYVLIHAAAGGVGLAAVQIAKLLGANVIATVGSKAKADVVRNQGADHVINYRTNEDWPDQVRKLTPKQRGVDIVFDPVGLINASLKCIAWNGRLVVVGFTSGKIEKVATNRILLKNTSVVGLHWGPYEKFEPTQVPKVWDVLLRWLERGDLKPVVYHQVYRGLDQVKDALDAIASRSSYGKVVVQIAQDPRPRL